MLQQTQVKTVIPYWLRWMERFPDVPSLARAETDAVLKAWEGLGYYSRARNLQAAAQMIVRDFGGHFPTVHEQVITLPGIGPYTAGAVCSFAFNQPMPILDGNVERVLTRLGAVRGNPREPRLRKALWQAAENWVKLAAGRPARCADGLAGNCSAVNQALMELGAVICTPKAPRCGKCPVAKHCRALREGSPERYPELPTRAAVTARRFHAFVWQHQNAVWVVQRPRGVVNGGLWEFPNVEVTEKPSAQAIEFARRLWRIRGTGTNPLRTVRHSITRYRIELQAHIETVDRDTQRHLRQWVDSSSGPVADFPESGVNPSPWIAAEWVGPDGLQSKAFTAAHRRIVEAWLEQRHAKPERQGDLFVTSS